MGKHGKPNYAVYLAGGKTPDPWGSLPTRVLLNQPEIDGTSLLDSNQNPVLNEIRMNQAAFEYIVQRTLYSKKGQLAFFNDPKSPQVQFPAEAMEIKAAWLILTPGDARNSRYYTIESGYFDQNKTWHPVLAGLGESLTSRVRCCPSGSGRRLNKWITRRRPVLLPHWAFHLRCRA